MTRPSIVRADTIDLQDHDSPSAKDHHRQPHPAGDHQAETLREVAHEQAEDLSRSPRLSWDDGHHPQSQFQDHHDAANDDIATGVSSRMAAQNTQQQQQQAEDEQHEDALAVAQNGGVSSSDEGDMDGDDLDDDMMDRISSSPSIEDEDIDFEFVYALHTFVATVEGQANATKGDTMVLLDDSNSYWWLVRVVKDSSIGYLPAEHIETPTERLARLNKHRNVDLSQSMLGDQAAKSKNSFKSIRKRFKSVTFSEPTYVDYTTGDYSSDEEDMEELFGQDVTGQTQDQQQDQTTSQRTAGETEITDEDAKVEPLKTKSSKDETATEDGTEDGERRSSEEILDGRTESRSRNGTLRNTDSFFKDDSAEPKKISLTPNLLKDESAGRPSTDSTASKNTNGRPSLDSKMEKELVTDKDAKKKTKNDKEKDKKEKDKKPSAFRNLFSRKDKRRTSEDDDGESFGKRSMDVISEPRESEDPLAEEELASEKAPSRSPSKLQKQQPRTEPSPTRKTSVGSQKKPPQADISSQFTETRTNDVSNVPPASMRIVDPETQETKEISSQQRPSPREEQQGTMGNLAKSLLPRSASSGNTVSKPPKATKAKERMELDESDSSEEGEAILQSAATPEGQPSSVMPIQEQGKLERPTLPGAFPDSYQDSFATTTSTASDQTVTRAGHSGKDRLSESPVEVSPVSQPPGLMADAPSPGESPSPDLGQNDGQGKEGKDWDDTKLRAFFDQGDHVRDLLAVVYDTSDVEPAGSDHPMVNGLFREQNAKLAEITTQLDNMLGDWLARKQRSRGTL